MTDERTREYLLEELTELEAEQFEEQCFAQDEWPAGELESAEHDLIDAYIKKELTPERERRFEEQYLTTDARKVRVLIARSFLGLVCSNNHAKPSVAQRVLAWLKMVVSGSWLPIPKFATAVLAVGLAATLLWYSTPPKAPQTFADISLQISNDTRSTNKQAEIVNLPISQDALRISLALPASDPANATYRVQWEDVKGPLEDLKIESQDAKSITVVIPSDKLRPGQYSLELFHRNQDGTERPVPGSYLFEVR
jgi:hypothetical protein